MDLTGISQQQQERLCYIDFRAWFLGRVGRSDIVSRFGMAEAAATRDLALYKELAPDNLLYSAGDKTYLASSEFKPLYDHKPEHVLTALSQGFGDEVIGESQASLSCETPTQLNQPDLEVLSQLTRAIYQKRVVDIEYISPESGKSKREVAPHVLVDSGLRWHVRAYDRKRKAFIDFVINRITKAKLQDDLPGENELASADDQWQQSVELELVPHPNIKHPNAIEMDYNMVGGVKKEKTRVAVAGYVLRRWNVDCSEDHSLQGPEYQLWLRNSAKLQSDVDMILAPGGQPEYIH